MVKQMDDTLAKLINRAEAMLRKLTREYYVDEDRALDTLQHYLEKDPKKITSFSKGDKLERAVRTIWANLLSYEDKQRYLLNKGNEIAAALNAGKVYLEDYDYISAMAVEDLIKLKDGLCDHLETEKAYAYAIANPAYFAEVVRRKWANQYMSSANNKEASYTTNLRKIADKYGVKWKECNAAKIAALFAASYEGNLEYLGVGTVVKLIRQDRGLIMVGLNNDTTKGKDTER